MLCRACQREIPDNSLYCNWCGEKQIKKRREELGLSVEEVAKLLGKHRATIYRYESSEIEKFPTNTLEPLAAVLQTTPAYLMGWEDPTPDQPPEPLPHSKFREVLSESGIRLLLDEDANVPDENVEDIIKYIKLRQGQVGR